MIYYISRAKELHINIRACLYISRNVGHNSHTHIHTLIHTHTETHTHSHTYTNTHQHTATHKHTPTHTHPHTHSHLNTHTYIYIYLWYRIRCSMSGILSIRIHHVSAFSNVVYPDTFVNLLSECVMYIHCTMYMYSVHEPRFACNQMVYIL